MIFSLKIGLQSDVLLECSCLGPITREKLLRMIEEKKLELTKNNLGKFGFLVFEPTLASVVLYLACLDSKRVLLLLPSEIQSSQMARLKETYHPDWLAEIDIENTLTIRDFSGSSANDAEAINDKLALLLLTSGSTGDPKLVRLSLANLEANASSICDYLNISKSSCSITTLPLSYSFGLSILNSYLKGSGRLVMSKSSVLDKNFMSHLIDNRVTSLSGVPYMYDMMLRIGLLSNLPESVNTLTVAGGPLSERTRNRVYPLCEKNKMRLYVMYGQTEATARISYVPNELLPSKLGSIGIPIPGGELSIDQNSGEIVYMGPNVMLGYAENRDHLLLGDELNGCLKTGDAGYKDADGCFYITHRLKRIIKIAGRRLSLDDVERLIEEKFGSIAIVVGQDNKCEINIERTVDIPSHATVKDWVCHEISIHHSMLDVSFIDKLPFKNNGKKDYSFFRIPGEVT